MRRSRPGPRLVLGALLVLVLLPTLRPAPVGATAPEAVPVDDDGVELVLFWLDGCPHCEAEREFLDELTTEEPRLRVTDYELSSSAEGRALAAAEGERLGFEPRAVPITIIGDRYWIGFGDQTADELRAEVARQLADTEPVDEPAGPPASDIEPAADADPSDGAAADDSTVVDVPLVGDVDVAGRSLVLATLLIALVDGINPCSLWVLSVLLALVLHTGSRRRVLAVGSAFLVTTTLMYGLYVVGAYGVLSYARYLGWIERAVAAVALVAGLVVIKDGLGVRAGPSLTIADSRKPGLVRRMRDLASPERSLASALGATVVLGVGVSLIETPCSATLPILWTDLLAANDVGIATAAGLFGLYMLVFLVDELAVFAAAVVTMRALKLQQRHGRTLQLVSGSVLVVLAGAMVIDPALLTELSGVVAVATAAAALTALLLWFGRGRGDATGDRAPSAGPARPGSSTARRGSPVGPGR